MTLLASLSAVVSVSLGAAYMAAAGAPRQYLLVNAAALAAGLTAAPLCKRIARHRRMAAAAMAGIGLALLATALFGVRIDGASRWVRVAGLSLEPSLILLPPAIMHFARQRDWWSSICLAIAALSLALQPDRSMAGTLAAALGVLWLQRREPPVTIALATAFFAFVITMLQADRLPAVAFVEQVVQSAFAFHALAGLAILTGLAILLVPAAEGLRSRTQDREVAGVFGVMWLSLIVFALVGNYPTPLVGYGTSAILGYCLSASLLRR